MQYLRTAATFLARIIHERAAFMINAPLCVGFCRHRLRHHAARGAPFDGAQGAPSVSRGAQDVARARPERRPKSGLSRSPTGGLFWAFMNGPG